MAIIWKNILQLPFILPARLNESRSQISSQEKMTVLRGVAFPTFVHFCGYRPEWVGIHLQKSPEIFHL